MVRRHPILPFSELLGHLNSNSKPIETIVISEGNTPIEDIHGADALIHWESTVGLEALYLGTPVIHCDLGGSFKFRSACV